MAPSHFDLHGQRPVTNLELVRQISCRMPGYAPGAPKLLLTHAQAVDRRFPTDANYVGNVMWSQSNVLFVALNIRGGSNNNSDPWYGAPNASTRQDDERIARIAAQTRRFDKPVRLVVGVNPPTNLSRRLFLEAFREAKRPNCAFGTVAVDATSRNCQRARSRWSAALLPSRYALHHCIENRHLLA